MTTYSLCLGNLCIPFFKLYLFMCLMQKIFSMSFDNDEVSLTFSRIVEQVKVIQEVVLPEICKLTEHETRNKETKHNLKKKIRV